MQDLQQPPKRHCILLADDYAIIIEALRSLLIESYDVVGVVTDGRALLVEAIKLKPDVVALDVGMPLMNGLDAAAQSETSAPEREDDFLNDEGRSQSGGGPESWAHRIRP